MASLLHHPSTHRSAQRTRRGFGLIIALGAMICTTGATQAELDYVNMEYIDNGMDGLHTVQVAAYFDNQLDEIEAVFGNSFQELSLNIIGGSGLWNDDLGTGTPLDDTPSILHGPFDSWVGFTGDVASISPSFTPDFMGVPDGGFFSSVFVDGTRQLSDDNSAYFIPGGLPVESVSSTGRVVIAQFTIANPGLMTFGGGIQYNQGVQEYFWIQSYIPAPATLAVLVLAMGPHRRRRG